MRDTMTKSEIAFGAAEILEELAEILDAPPGASGDLHMELEDILTAMRMAVREMEELQEESTRTKWAERPEE